MAILNRFGFVIYSQRGSHVKLRRTTASGSQETLTVPLHDDVDLGTLRAIFRQASRYITEDELFPHFYTE